MYWKVVLTAALPISELRGAIPIGIWQFKLPVWQVFILAIIGNMLPIPFVLKFLDKIEVIVSRAGWGRRFFSWLYSHVRKRSDIIERYGYLGLTMFVAIPLPVTGAWTGSIAAFLMGMRVWRALLHIFIGVMIAGVIVTLVSLMGKLGAVIGAIIFLTPIFVHFIRGRK